MFADHFSSVPPKKNTLCPLSALQPPNGELLFGRVMSLLYPFILQMRKKKLRKREEAGTSSSLGLEAAIHDSTIKNGNGGSSSAARAAAAAAATNGGVGRGEGSGDHGSRAARAERMAAKAQEEAGDKRKRFDTALARAGERANDKLADSFSKPAAPSSKVGFEAGGGDWRGEGAEFMVLLLRVCGAMIMA